MHNTYVCACAGFAVPGAGAGWHDQERSPTWRESLRSRGEHVSNDYLLHCP